MLEPMRALLAAGFLLCNVLIMGIAAAGFACANAIRAARHPQESFANYTPGTADLQPIIDRGKAQWILSASLRWYERSPLHELAETSVAGVRALLNQRGEASILDTIAMDKLRRPVATLHNALPLVGKYRADMVRAVGHALMGDARTEDSLKAQYRKKSLLSHRDRLQADGSGLTADGLQFAQAHWAALIAARDLLFDAFAAPAAVADAAPDGATKAIDAALWPPRRGAKLLLAN